MSIIIRRPQAVTNDGISWLRNHVCGPILEKDLHAGYHYETYPGSIGSSTYIVCDKCKQKHDITDYSGW